MSSITRCGEVFFISPLLAAVMLLSSLSCSTRLQLFKHGNWKQRFVQKKQCHINLQIMPPHITFFIFKLKQDSCLQSETSGIQKCLLQFRLLPGSSLPFHVRLLPGSSLPFQAPAFPSTPASFQAPAFPSFNTLTRLSYSQLLGDPYLIPCNLLVNYSVIILDSPEMIDVLKSSEVDWKLARV